MRNILFIVGSGHRHGNTNQLSNAFRKGATDAGHRVIKVNLDLDIQGCKGCGACQKNGHQCIIQDQMQDIYPLFEKADMIAFASPLYFWGISGRLKSVIDRLYAMSTHDQYSYKETVLLMTSGSQAFYAFEQSFYRFIINALGWKDLGMVLSGGCEEKDGQKFVREEFMTQAYELGKQI